MSAAPEPKREDGPVRIYREDSSLVEDKDLPDLIKERFTKIDGDLPEYDGGTRNISGIGSAERELKRYQEPKKKSHSIIDEILGFGRRFGGSTRNQSLERLKKRQAAAPQVLEYMTEQAAGETEPSKQEVAQAAKRVGLQYYDYGVAKVLSDLASGGKIIPELLWRRALRETEKPLPSNKEMKRVESFLRQAKSIPFQKIPAPTSLDKATFALKLLGMIKQNPKQSRQEPVPQAAPGEEEIINAKELSTMAQALEEANSMSEAEAQILLMAGGRGYDREPSRGLELTQKIAEELVQNDAAKIINKVAQVLNQIPQLGANAEIRRVRAEKGEEKSVRKMETLEELPKITKSNWALYFETPQMFWSKAFNHEFDVRERMHLVKKKQLLHLLVDSSGSMASGNRITLALAVLANRLKAVMSDEASLSFRFFDESIMPLQRAESKDEAVKAIQTLRRNNYSGGGTNISLALRTAISDIKKSEGRVRPHLALISDGIDNELNVTSEELKGIVFHVFLTGTRHPGLERLAKSTGGVAACLGDDGSVKMV